MNLVFKASDNPYTNEKLFKICEDYGVPHNPLKYRDEKFYWTYQQGVKMVGRLQGFTDTGLLRISESVRAYVYLILTLIYMGYFDYLFYKGGGGQKSPQSNSGI